MADFDLLVNDGTVVTASDTWICDDGVKDGKISALGRALPSGAKTNMQAASTCCQGTQFPRSHRAGLT